MAIGAWLLVGLGLAGVMAGYAPAWGAIAVGAMVWTEYLLATLLALRGRPRQ
jgi:hypothetical protein